RGRRRGSEPRHPAVDGPDGLRRRQRDEHRAPGGVLPHDRCARGLRRHRGAGDGGDARSRHACRARAPGPDQPDGRRAACAESGVRAGRGRAGGSRADGVTRVPAIRQARRILDSGAVVVARRHTLTPAVTAMLSFDAGSVFDPAERPGLAAFTARMIDRGTPRLSADALAEAIEQRGATIDVTSNRQCVAISLTCLIDDFQDMLTLATDMARTPSFPDDQIELRRHETLTRIAQDAENTAMRASARVFE